MIYFVILFFKLGFTSAKIKQATTEPIAMDARYSSGLTIVGTTKMQTCGVGSVQ